MNALELLPGMEPDAAEIEAARLRNLLQGVIYLRLLSDRLTKLNAQIDQDAVTLRDAGASWFTIGESLGISRQAAQQRYGSR